MKIILAQKLPNNLLFIDNEIDEVISNNLQTNVFINLGMISSKHLAPILVCRLSNVFAAAFLTFIKEMWCVVYSVMDSVVCGVWCVV